MHNAPFRSHPTQQDALYVALKHLLVLGLTIAEIARKYDMSRSTLIRIKKGKVISYHRQWIYDTLVMALNDCRLKALMASDNQQVKSISQALIEVCLINSKIAPDKEIRSLTHS